MSAKGELYGDYAAFKDWRADPDVGHPEDFAALLGSSGLSGHGLNLLEIGFGSGVFMDWAKGAGHSVVGLEILPEMIEAVRARGHQVYQEAPADLAPLDAIIAIDVLEHLDWAAFGDLMRLAHRTLKPHGVLIARFPNGDSPFFGRYQYGDWTHEKPLSAQAVGQMAAIHGMQVARAFNLRSLPSGFGRRLKRRAAYFARDLFETVLGVIYVGYRYPMDPNIAVVLKRASAG